MNRAVRTLITVFCLFVMAIFVVGLLSPNVLSLFTSASGEAWRGARLNWGKTALTGVYIAIAIWAYGKYMVSDTSLRKCLFLSIVVTDALMLSSELIVLMKPDFAGLCRFPLQAAFSYLFALCLFVGLFIETRAASALESRKGAATSPPTTPTTRWGRRR